MFNRQFLISLDENRKYLKFHSEYFTPPNYNGNTCGNETDIDFYFFEGENENQPIKLAFHCDANYINQKIKKIFKDIVDMDQFEKLAFEKIKMNLASTKSIKDDLVSAVIDFALCGEKVLYDEIQKQKNGYGIIIIFNSEDKNKSIESIIPREINVASYRIN
jgi:ribosomal protein S6